MGAVVINGESREIEDGQRNLLSFIRFDLGLTGTKYACGEGECGACTVLVDGEPVKTCMEHASLVEGKDVVTIEGLARDGRLHPVQEAFIEASAMQCGYCIPGFIMAAAALLQREKSPSRERIREALSENICRCGTYPRIERAVANAATKAMGITS
jgi:aerobic-type carbon monoxide dehydrogenase small subunit (CoxS/CutS family)